MQVDHSIIESFAQGGRTCITSRVYPTKAINNDAQVFLFNNATHAKIKASLQIWQMSSAFRHGAVLCVHALIVLVVSIIL